MMRNWRQAGCGLMMHGIMLAGVMLASGCAPDALKAGFDGPDPASRLHAARSAASSTNPGDVPELVALLDDDDPVVRWVAIGALRKRTGEDFGYDHTLARADRREAIAKWQAFLQSQEK